MIRKINDIFELSTDKTSYIFRLMDTGHLEHLHYGKKITVCEDVSMDALFEKQAFALGNTNEYDKEHKNMTLEDICLEMSSYGKGDIREAFVSLIYPDGSRTSDFLYVDHEITKGKEEFNTLPGSYDESDQVDHLKITLKDSVYDVFLELHYFVYEKCDVITRSSKLRNECSEEIKLLKLMSTELDFAPDNYVMTTFNGAWAREMKKNDIRLMAGKHVNSSFSGTSSSKANPFVMLSKVGTTEDFGDCYGLNLIYSGNHYEMSEISSYGKLRFLSGINPEGFDFILQNGDEFESPEAVMSYSCSGFNGMSHNMHTFVREHIVRGSWKNKVRPVLLNSWEAAYFKINESKLLSLAKDGAKAGIELFVLDDGWFGKRNDDTSSLGDWEVNPEKFPKGLSHFADEIKKLGMSFGIWVEPEMVNVDSKLYEAHPEWAIDIEGRAHSEGRNQRILDLTNEDVQEYIIESMTKVFGSADISYVKWDMNRTFTDIYSKNLPKDRQGEVLHRYYIGLYRCMKELTKRFPDILFEGCSAGGNRFDLGILSYFPQIWASDDTDALCRSEIQNNYSYGYPMSTVSAHVSGCPNHQTLRTTSLQTRFNVAAFGVCGYECNFSDMKKEEMEEITEQIKLYKEWREVLQFGDFYRGKNYDVGESNYAGALSASTANELSFTCVSKDKTKAVGLLMQRLVIPNSPFHKYVAKGLLPDAKYHFYNRELKYNIKGFGDLVNTASPIHIKQDSMLHNIVSKFVKMDGEKEEYTLTGEMLMNAGVKLKQAFSATGYSDEVRYYPDFASRIYFMDSEVN